MKDAVDDGSDENRPSSAKTATPSSKKKRPAPSPTNSTAKSTASSKRGKTVKSSPNSEKSSRGLRHFSMMVCQKVEEKGTTTYNEVADELVKKVLAERQGAGGKFDEKNIRRRVYDALNVLMAMDIISKEKKEITWKGLPTFGRQDLDSLREEVDFRNAQVQQKRDALRELLVQQVCFRNLVWHNHQRGPSEEKIPLPFIVVNTHASAVIQCDMSRDRTDVMFDFNMPFEINDDNTILKNMGMDKASTSVLREMLPDDLMNYCEEHRLLDGVVTQEPRSHRATPPHPAAHRYHAQQQQQPPPHYSGNYDPL